MNCQTQETSNCLEFAIPIQRTIVVQQTAYIKAHSREQARRILGQKMSEDNREFDQELQILNNPDDWVDSYSVLEGFGDEIWSWLSSVTDLRDKDVQPLIMSIVSRLSEDTIAS